MVHVLNPYGMAWLRRVNENNVDLNRNFRAADDNDAMDQTGDYLKLEQVGPNEGSAGKSGSIQRSRPRHVRLGADPFWWHGAASWHLCGRRLLTRVAKMVEAVRPKLQTNGTCGNIPLSFPR